MCEKAGATGKVYAIEPDPWNVEMLTKNINRNKFDKITEIHPIAVSDYQGEIEFWQSNKSNLSSVQKTKHSNKSITVKCESLTSFLQDGKIKIEQIVMDICQNKFGVPLNGVKSVLESIIHHGRNLKESIKSLIQDCIIYSVPYAQVAFLVYQSFHIFFLGYLYR